MENLILFRIASLTSESVTNTGLPRARMLIRRKARLRAVEELCVLKENGEAHSIIDKVFLPESRSSCQLHDLRDYL